MLNQTPSRGLLVTNITPMVSFWAPWTCISNYSEVGTILISDFFSGVENQVLKIKTVPFFTANHITNTPD
jgi:hypothetical protein